MASFRKRGNSWYYLIQGGINPKTGKYVQIQRGGFKTKKDAQVAAAEAQVSVDSGTFVASHRVRFQDVATDWLKSYALNVKKSSVRIREHQIALLCEVLGKIPLQSITPKVYQRALDTLTESGFAANTISGAHTTARMIFKRACECYLLKEDPSRFARPPRRQSRSIQQLEAVPRYLEKEQLHAFLAAAREKGLAGDYALFTLLAYTGMRVGELLALTWQDIDKEEGTVSISKTLYIPDNNASHYELLPPKTVSGYRVIDVPQEVMTALAGWRHEYLLEKMRWGPDWHDAYDFIFPAVNRHGYPRTQKQVQVRIDRLQKLLKLPVRITPHVFRHTHISLLAEAGVALHEIMDRVGQTDDETTKRVYLHVTEHRKKEASRLFSALMQSVKTV